MVEKHKHFKLTRSHIHNDKDAASDKEVKCWWCSKKFPITHSGEWECPHCKVKWDYDIRQKKKPKLEVRRLTDIKYFWEFLIISHQFRTLFKRGFLSGVAYVSIILFLDSIHIVDSIITVISAIGFFSMLIYWVLLLIGYGIGLIKYRREESKKRERGYQDLAKQSHHQYEDNSNKSAKSQHSHQEKGKKTKWLVSGGIAVAVFIFIWLLNSGALSSYFNIYPMWPTGPKTTTLLCNYAGKNLQTNLTLYSNVDSYYKNLNPEGKNTALRNEDFAKFVYWNHKDTTVRDLASQISNIAIANHFTDDQSLELATCFIQNIPYDKEKSDFVLNGNGNNASTEQYPYETLFNNKGICTDKTYLGNAVLDQMGFGTSIMIFPNDKHMALGVSVPSGYTSFGSSYAIMDVTTTGFAPGNIPESIEKTGLPNSNLDQINKLSPKDSPDSIKIDTSKEIGPPSKVIPVFGGKSYTRIVAVKNLENQIIASINSLATKKANLQKANSNVSYWNNIQAQNYSSYMSTPATTQTCYPTYSFYPYYSSRQNCYDSPNFLKTLKRNTYNNSYNNYQNAINNYNKLVDDYNKTIEQIKSNINLYQSYEYN